LYDELLRAPLGTGARAVVWAHKGEIEEVRTNEEGCVLNLNDPETMNTALPAEKLTIRRWQLLKERVDHVSRELCAVESGRGKSPESLGEQFGGDLAGLRRRAATEFFGQEGGAGNRCGASAAKKARFGDAPVHNASRELEDVTTNRIACLYRCRGAGQFSRIARITKVIENGFAEHP